MVHVALQIGRAFQDGIDELLSERGALFVGVFIVYGLINSVVSASLSQAFTDLFLSELPTEAQASQAPIAGSTPLAFEIPLAVAGVSALVLYVVSEALTIVAIRAFASDSRDPIPNDVTRRLSRTVAVTIAAAILTGIVTAIGFVLLIIPGLVLAVLFFFVKQEIALNDSGIIESIRNSVSVVRDNLLATVVLAVVLAALGVVVGLSSQALPIPAVALAVITTAVSGVVTVFSITVTTTAYLQVTEPMREANTMSSL